MKQKQDSVLIAFLISFIVLCILLTGFVYYQNIDLNKNRIKLARTEEKNNFYREYIEKHNAQYQKLDNTIYENNRLGIRNSILEARNSQLELVLDTRISRDNIPYKVAFLTFDDGPTYVTPKVLDTLKKYNIQATFFVLGRTSEFSKRMYKRILDEGHVLANHSYTHNYAKMYRNMDTFLEDFYELQNYIKEETGFEMKAMRFPGGSNNHVSRKYGGKLLMGKLADRMEEEGIIVVDWNVTSGDATSIRKHRTKNYVADRVIRGTLATDQAVILMHDKGGNDFTADALPRIIETLIEEGYVFLPITENYKSFLPEFDQAR